MNLLKVAAVLLLILVATAIWRSGMFNRTAHETDVTTVHASTNGFTFIPMPDGMPPRGIVIFAPQNCPSDAAQRARKLADYLSTHHLAYANSSSANYSNLSSQAEVNQVTAVMNGKIPIVYVNGKAKANPTPEEVVAEFNQTR
jgi:hypothetical protein